MNILVDTGGSTLAYADLCSLESGLFDDTVEAGTRINGTTDDEQNPRVNNLQRRATPPRKGGVSPSIFDEEEKCFVN